CTDTRRCRVEDPTRARRAWTSAGNRRGLPGRSQTAPSLDRRTRGDPVPRRSHAEAEGGSAMVFRRDNKAGDAFQRQISALRQQLGDSPAEGTDEEAGATLASAEAPTSGYDEYGAAGTAELAPGLSDAVSRAGEYESRAEHAAMGGGVAGSVAPTDPELPSLP